MSPQMFLKVSYLPEQTRRLHNQYQQQETNKEIRIQIQDFRKGGVCPSGCWNWQFQTMVQWCSQRDI